MSLEYLINFRRSLEKPLINCKVEFKLKWTNHCVLSAAGADNTNANPRNIIFTFRDTKLYVPVVSLSAKDNWKLSKDFSRGFEKSGFWNKYKTKKENKNTKNEYRFLESNFVGVGRLFVLVYSNQDNNAKRFTARGYCLPKVIIKNYCAIINKNNFYDELTDSYIKRFQEIRRLTLGQDEDYTTGCFQKLKLCQNSLSVNYSWFE